MNQKKFLKRYNQWLLENKSFKDIIDGFTVDIDSLNPKLLGFQKLIIQWALAKGKAAVFASTGLGKTLIQAEWANQIVKKTGKKVIIVAPLCVAYQTVREAKKLNIEIEYLRKQKETKSKIIITNYEMIEHFNLDDYIGIVLDESSILKSDYGSIKKRIIEMSRNVPFRLSATATPSPNDYVELGNQSEFLGIMPSTEMLATFFTHDGGETSKWRLKGHGVRKFWEWLSTWAVVIQFPSDLGDEFKEEDKLFELPPINYIHHKVEQPLLKGFVNPVARTLEQRRKAQNATMDLRCEKMAEIVNKNKKEPWLIWCHRNRESELLTKNIDSAKEVTGSMKTELKESVINSFTNEETGILVSKPSICGFGMNWQHCSNVGFVGLNDSFEMYYQAVRRCWRFGQKKTVNVHIISADTEGNVVTNIKRKEEAFHQMQKEMLKYMRQIQHVNIHKSKREIMEVKNKEKTVEGKFTLYLGDCIEVCANKLQDQSVDYSIFSPPFSLLYAYSNSERDMGNSKDDQEFYKQFEFLVEQLFRVIKEGRLVSFHCMNLPIIKQRAGYIGINDFRGELIRLFQSKGFIFHSEVCIWKDPVTAMQRTKAIGLLYKQLKKDSSLSRMGIPDYVVTMRKPGENPEPITKNPKEFPVHIWQKYASPVWDDINPSDTLQFRTARENDDERHICPLQLTVIRRCMELWTNPKDVVLTPFAGIGSEMYVALGMGRKALGIELKESYFNLALHNCKKAVKENKRIENSIIASTAKG